MLAALASPAEARSWDTHEPLGSVASGDLVPLLVKFKPSEDADSVIAATGGNAARQHIQIGWREIHVPVARASEVLGAYARHGSVQHAAQSIRLANAGTPNDPSYSQQWSLPARSRVRDSWLRPFWAWTSQGATTNDLFVLDRCGNCRERSVPIIVTIGAPLSRRPVAGGRAANALPCAGTRRLIVGLSRDKKLACPGN